MDTYPFFKIVCVHIYFVNELRCMNKSNRFGILIFFIISQVIYKRSGNIFKIQTQEKKWQKFLSLKNV